MVLQQFNLKTLLYLLVLNQVCAGLFLQPLEKQGQCDSEMLQPFDSKKLIKSFKAILFGFMHKQRALLLALLFF